MSFDLLEYNKLETLVGTESYEQMLDKIASEKLNLVFWKDMISELGDVRKETLLKDEEGSQIVRHERYDGFILQQGTDVNSENLGQMEYNDLINFANIKKIWDILIPLALQVSTLTGTINSNMPYNTTFFSAKNINTDMIILEGYYDEVNGRGVI